MTLDDDISSKCGILNCPPAEDSENATLCYDRLACDYSDLSQNFRQNSKDFTKQFAHIYAIRLNLMKDSLKRKATNKWGSDYKICRLVELQESNGEKCVIIGTLFVDQRLKPSILKEISEEAQLVPQPVLKSFVSDGDILILEDELQRIVLHGSVDVHKVVTGVVCALLGQEDPDGGKFHVEDICWAGVDSSVPPAITPGNDQFVVLLSGLDLASNANLLQVHLLLEWFSGFLGDPQDQLRTSKVVRIIIAGNSLRCDEEKKDNKVIKTTAVEAASSTLSAIQLLDDFLSNLVHFVDVDLMPGEFDPTNHTLPQQPLHYCMFPKASRFESLHGVPNPYRCSVNGRQIVGTAGQPVDDIARYSNLTDPLTTLQQTLEWGHLAPTSPDTLPCYPFYESDPFILDTSPDIYFAGNQDTFQNKIIELPNGSEKPHKVQLICLPSFAKTSTCAVVNLSTLECHPQVFEVWSK